MFFRFAQIDKDWIKILTKSAETRLVVACCQNEMLKQLLPVLGENTLVPSVILPVSSPEKNR